MRVVFGTRSINTTELKIKKWYYENNGIIVVFVHYKKRRQPFHCFLVTIQTILKTVVILPKQIIKYNRWQQRNGPIIHDVTSVKYNKENNIFSY